MLHAKDRGCTAPGCTAPGYLCEVHHVEEWATGGATDIDKLTFACTGHHKLLDHGWTTKKLANGDTQWIPPPQLPSHWAPTPTTTPEKLLEIWGRENAFGPQDRQSGGPDTRPSRIL